MHAVVVSFDHLHLGFIGCYGNDWIETPNLDKLAVESVVFDQHFGENFDRDAAEQAWWTGRYQFSADPSQPFDRAWLAELLRNAGVATRLVVETDGDDDFVVAPHFDEIVTVAAANDIDVPEAEAGFARLVTEAGRSLQQFATGTNRHSLLWLKSRGVPSPWVPPREFADLYFDEFGLEREAAAAVDVEQADDLPKDEPGVEEDDGDYPDEISAEFLATDVPPTDVASLPPQDVELRYARAFYAGYVTYVDRWLGKLLATIEQSPHREHTLLIVVAGGGELLGEHGALGDEEDSLHEELVHAPLIVRIPGSDQAGSRRGALVQTVDIAPTLLEWFGVPSPPPALDGASLLPLIRGDCDSLRDTAYMGVAGRASAIRTAAFAYIRSETAPEDAACESARLREKGSREKHSTVKPLTEPQLFEKPGDRWEMANALRQYPQLVDELEAKLTLHLRSRHP